MLHFPAECAMQQCKEAALATLPNTHLQRPARDDHLRAPPRRALAEDVGAVLKPGVGALAMSMPEASRIAPYPMPSMSFLSFVSALCNAAMFDFRRNSLGS